MFTVSQYTISSGKYGKIDSFYEWLRPAADQGNSAQAAMATLDSNRLNF